ncbi:MAG TPA: SH3-like domain-containing protein [Burkholderiales bacterium]|nr:SH3-like domain-containing protein [Burkholderiales bacterium]
MRFEGRELWGPDADPTVKVSVDAFEPYLEPA